MSQLHKKCMIVSAGAHLLIIGLLCMGAMLDPRIRPNSLPLLEFIPDQAVEDALAGGGGPPPAAPPQIAPPQEEPAAAPPEPVPEPVQPQQDPPKVVQKAPEPEPEPPKAQKKPEISLEPARKPAKTQKREQPSQTTETPAKEKRKIQPNLSVVQPDKSSAERRRRAEAEARRAQAEAASKARANAIARASRGLQQSLSDETEIFSPGTGAGAYASYGQIVKSKYHLNWTPPAELNDDSATTEATVVILRDGTVKSASITKRSRHPSLDGSVERALSLRSIGVPFPEGSRDAERTFLIRFNLKARRGAG